MSFNLCTIICNIYIQLIKNYFSTRCCKRSEIFHEYKRCTQRKLAPPKSRQNKCFHKNPKTQNFKWDEGSGDS